MKIIKEMNIDIEFNMGMYQIYVYDDEEINMSPIFEAEYIVSIIDYLKDKLKIQDSEISKLISELYKKYNEDIKEWEKNYEEYLNEGEKIK